MNNDFVSLPVGTQITFVGKVFKAEKLMKLGHARVFILPSKWRELHVIDGWVGIDRDSAGNLKIRRLTEEELSMVMHEDC